MFATDADCRTAELPSLSTISTPELISVLQTNWKSNFQYINRAARSLSLSLFLNYTMCACVCVCDLFTQAAFN